jgi:hypothetical protein
MICTADVKLTIPLILQLMKGKLGLAFLHGIENAVHIFREGFTFSLSDA